MINLRDSNGNLKVHIRGGSNLETAILKQIKGLKTKCLPSKPGVIIWQLEEAMSLRFLNEDVHIWIETTDKICYNTISQEY